MGLLLDEPSLPVLMETPAGVIATHLVLDSGAERTVLSGEYAAFLGLDLLAGVQVPISSAAGVLTAYLHRIRVSVDLDPSSTPGPLEAIALVAELDVALTAAPIPRSVLGRDFFNAFIVAFDESRGLLYLGMPGQSPVE